MEFLDFLFPKKCVACGKLGSYLCPDCFTLISFEAKNLCLICQKPSYNCLTHPYCLKKYAIDGCFSAIAYNGIAKKLVKNFKYEPYLLDLKGLLTDFIYESFIQNEQFQKELEKGEWIIIPIPLFSSKFRKRGYNQAEVLSLELAKKFKLKILNGLERIKNTKSQTDLTEKERQKNIRGAFKIKNGQWKMKNTKVFLFDDVLTTGSTLKEAAKILKIAGVKRVIGLSLARD